MQRTTGRLVEQSDGCIQWTKNAPPGLALTRVIQEENRQRAFVATRPRFIKHIPSVLPAQRAEHAGRLTVVLDLDETLVFTEPCDRSDAAVAAKLAPLVEVDAHRRSKRDIVEAAHLAYNQEKYEASQLENGYDRSAAEAIAAARLERALANARKKADGSAGRALPRWGLHDGDDDASAAFVVASRPDGATRRKAWSKAIMVTKRPGVDAFLAAAAAQFELVVWAEGSEAYANQIIAGLDPDGALFGDRRLFRAHCTARAGVRGGYVKCLERLGRPLHRVVLVDDNRHAALPQPNNCLPLSPFFAEPKELRQDTALASVLDLLLDLARLADDDVRPALRARFGLAEALAGSTVGRHLWVTHDGSADYSSRWIEPVIESESEEEEETDEEVEEAPPPPPPPPKPVVAPTLSETLLKTRDYICSLSRVQVKKSNSKYWAKKKKKKKKKRKEKAVESSLASQDFGVHEDGRILQQLENGANDDDDRKDEAPEAVGAPPPLAFSFIAPPKVKISWLTRRYMFFEAAGHGKKARNNKGLLPPV